VVDWLSQRMVCRVDFPLFHPLQVTSHVLLHAGPLQSFTFTR
jgi:hypothetical protein